MENRIRKHDRNEKNASPKMALISASPSQRPRSFSNHSELLSLALSLQCHPHIFKASARPSPHRGTVFLTPDVKMRILGSSPERLHAFCSSPPRAFGVFPAYVHILFSIFVRVGLATASLYRSPPFGLAPLLPTPSSQFNLSAIERLQALFVSHARLWHPPHPRLLPHLDLRLRHPRPTPVLTLPPSSPSTMPSAS